MTYGNVKLNGNQPKRKRRKLRKSFVISASLFLITFTLLLVFLFFPTTARKLKKIGYSPEAIEIIKQDKIANTLIDGNYFSENLQNAILSKNYDLKYLDLYLIQDKTTEDDTLLYDKLIA